MGTLAVALVVLDGLSLLRVDRQEDGLVGTLAVLTRVGFFKKERTEVAKTNKTCYAHR